MTGPGWPPSCGLPACNDPGHVVLTVEVYDQLPEPGAEPRTAVLVLCKTHDPNTTED